MKGPSGLKGLGPRTLLQKILGPHLKGGALEAGTVAALQPDQLLQHDTGGQMIALALMEAGGVETSGRAVQYIDHQLVQSDHRNPDDHAFLRSAARRHGLFFSPPGNGISHVVHQELVGRPGAFLLGVDSHTPSAGGLGMVGIGAGGLDVAMCLMGEPYHVSVPRTWGVELRGQLPEWVSAKDIILEVLRRHGVSGGRGWAIEYFGDGVRTLSVWDRHVIANMGTELGATTSVFPSDERTRQFLERQDRGDDWQPLGADEGASYDRVEVIILDELEPLIALPGSPGNVVSVRECAGKPIVQSYIGSSANPGYRDFAVAAEVLADERVSTHVSLDLNPGSRQVASELMRDGHMLSLIQAGGRLHQPGCNGCPGMGQAPPTGGRSLRTVPRNFPGRSGTLDDQVFLVSPETAAASALTGLITDPREIGRPHIPREPTGSAIPSTIEPPPPLAERPHIEIVTGPNIAPLPPFERLPEDLSVGVLLSLGDDVSTDDILPAGQKVLPNRANVPKLAPFAFYLSAPDYATEAERAPWHDGHAIVAGENYGQGSSREHAALVPRFLGLRVVLARSFGRIHYRNLVNWGVIPVELRSADDQALLERGCELRLQGIGSAVRDGATTFEVEMVSEARRVTVDIRLGQRERRFVTAGTALNALAPPNDDFVPGVGVRDG